MSISEDKKVRLRDPVTGAQINNTAQVQIANNGGSIGSFNSLATNFARNSGGTGSTITVNLTGIHSSIASVSRSIPMRVVAAVTAVQAETEAL